MLSEFGCDLAQGYLVARPQSALEFERWLENSQWQPLRLRAA
jgi:EAL domain-containing protein (putative c-di-GMP-specific phosphodiesterase class I)